MRLICVFFPIVFLKYLLEYKFWYQKKDPIFLITPVKFYGQKMLILKVKGENVAKFHNGNYGGYNNFSTFDTFSIVTFKINISWP